MRHQNEETGEFIEVVMPLVWYEGAQCYLAIYRDSEDELRAAPIADFTEGKFRTCGIGLEAPALPRPKPKEKEKPCYAQALTSPAS